MDVNKSVKGKMHEFRLITRQLLSSIRSHQQELWKDCPEEVWVWSTGLYDSCKVCNMNHFVAELHHIGINLYGSTVKEKKENITHAD